MFVIACKTSLALCCHYRLSAGDRFCSSCPWVTSTELATVSWACSDHVSGWTWDLTPLKYAIYVSHFVHDVAWTPVHCLICCAFNTGRLWLFVGSKKATLAHHSPTPTTPPQHPPQPPAPLQYKCRAAVIWLVRSCMICSCCSQFLFW